jgi:protoglobin
MTTAADLPRALRELADFVGFGDADADTIRRTAPIVLAHESALTAALYDHFLQQPSAARFFTHEDGTPDVERIERRKHSLGRWLQETAQAALGTETAYYLLAMGLSHSHRTWGRGGAVPAELMVGAMSLTQSALAKLFEANLSASEAVAASIAWNKLLLLHLTVLLRGYLRA